jgi:hypothetical protein
MIGTWVKLGEMGAAGFAVVLGMKYAPRLLRMTFQRNGWMR